MVYIKKENESLSNYILRLAEERKTNNMVTWQGISDALFTQYGVIKSEAWVRKFVKDELNIISEEEKILASIDKAKDSLDNTLFLSLKEYYLNYP